MRIYWIKDHFEGSLGMMARPRGNDWLETDIRKLSLNDTDVILSLLENSEIKELQLSKQEALCRINGIDYLNYPIPDRGLPESADLFQQTILSLHEKLNQGKRIVVHCRMGIGRTSMVCAALLILRGQKPDDVFKLLSDIRTLEVPDTTEQREWITTLNFEL